MRRRGRLPRHRGRGTVAISAPLGYQIQGDALVAFDLRTFEARWSFPLGSGNAWLHGSRPLVVDDLVFLAIGTRVHAVDRVTGAPVWTGTLSGKALTGGGLAAGSGHLVVPHEGGVDVFRTSGAGGDPGADDPGQGGPVDPGPGPGSGGVSTTFGGPDAGSATRTAEPLRRAATLRTSARRSGRRVVVTVRGPAKATGRVIVKVGRHSVTRSLKRGAVTVRVLLRRGERPARVTVRYVGDARFVPAQRTVKLRSAR